MFDGTSLIVLPFLSGVEGADVFNFFFSLVMAGGVMSFVPVAIMNLIKRS